MTDTASLLPLRRRLVIDPGEAADSAISHWLGAIQDARARTISLLEDTEPDSIDWIREGDNTIGTLLYHIAAIEADWLYVEVLEQPFPVEIIDLFPYDVRDSDGNLTHVSELTLDQHLARLTAVRRHLLRAFSVMTPDDFLRPRRLPDYDVSPEWIIHHLMQHEAEHRGEIGLLKAAAKRSLR